MKCPILKTVIYPLINKQHYISDQPRYILFNIIYIIGSIKSQVLSAINDVKQHFYTIITTRYYIKSDNTTFHRLPPADDPLLASP